MWLAGKTPGICLVNQKAKRETYWETAAAPPSPNLITSTEGPSSSPEASREGRAYNYIKMLSYFYITYLKVYRVQVDPLAPHVPKEHPLPWKTPENF